MLEFQSTVDHLMALRIRNYVDNLHMEQWRGRWFRSTDRLAPVLPIKAFYMTRAQFGRRSVGPRAVPKAASWARGSRFRNRRR